MSARGRLGRMLGYDGPVAGMLLGTFGCFTASVSFVVSLLPLLAFQALVGWQPTHLAIWLGALSLLTLFPAVFALLAAGAELLDAGFASARPGRRYWRAFADACRTLWWAAVAVPALAVLLGYDLALTGGGDAVFLLVVAAGAIAATLAVGVAVTAGDSGERAPRVVVVAAVRAIARRPHVALCWLLLAALAGAAATLPWLGALAALLLPAPTAAAVHVCDRALGFAPRPEGARSEGVAA